MAVAAAVWTACVPAAAAQEADECPNGWSVEAAVEFAPPVPALDSGVANRERAGGCTLLDDIWAAEPFATHGAFVARVDRVTREYVRAGLLSGSHRRAILTAAGRSAVGGPDDRQVDNSCPNRIAITFDDGVSAYRPQTLQTLRDKQVHGVFYDNGFRVADRGARAVG